MFGENRLQKRRRRRTANASLTGILAGAVHSGHPSTLLTGGGLFQPEVNYINQGKFLVVPQHVSIDVIIDAHVLCMTKMPTFRFIHDVYDMYNKFAVHTCTQYSFILFFAYNLKCYINIKK